MSNNTFSRDEIISCTFALKAVVAGMEADELAVMHEDVEATFQTVRGLLAETSDPVLRRELEDLVRRINVIGGGDGA